MHMNARTRAHNIRAHTCKRAHITRTYTHIRTYTYIVRTPNNNVKNTSPTITKKVLRNSLVIVIIPLQFFLFIAFDYFSRSQRALQSKLSGNLLTSSFACKTRRQHCCQSNQTGLCMFFSKKGTHENAKANRMKE